MNTNKELPASFHFIGIGGSGMSVVAELLLNRGATVSGSDRSDSPTLRSLQQLGIDAYFPHGDGNYDPDAVVVRSSAIKEDNAELVAGRQRGQKVIHRSEALALAAQGQKFVAVAGTHGKTTTSAMIAVGLLDAGLDPSFAIGASIDGVGTGARTGRDIFVAEADESDRSFLNYTPTIEVITNIGVDHTVNYASEAELRSAFQDFVQRIEPGGVLICCAEDAGSWWLAQNAGRSDIEIRTYGRPQRSFGVPDVQIIPGSMGRSELSASIVYREQTFPLELQVTAEHNLVNAGGAWAALVALGLSGDEASRGLAAFEGTRRRFEEIGVRDGRILIDDYAHHPAELQSALSQARLAVGDGRVVAVFQPHLYSRTQFFAKEFAQVLELADVAVVTDIDGSREDPVPGVTSALILDQVSEGADIRGGGSAFDSATLGADLTGPGDICILMGCGDIYLQEPTVISRWEETGPPVEAGQ